MLKKIKKPTALGLAYDPITQELMCLLDLAIYYVPTKQWFGVDQNPHGDPMLTEVSNITGAQDSSKLEFEANYKGVQTHFEIALNSKLSQEIANTLLLANSTGIQPTDNEDAISFIFEDGEGILRVVTYVDDISRDHFSIYSEEDGHFYVVQNPWQRIRLDKLRIIDNVLIISSGDWQLERKLTLSNSIFSVFRPIIGAAFEDILQK